MKILIKELMNRNFITQEQVLQAQARRYTDPKPLQDLLIEMGFLKEEDLFLTAKAIFPGRSIDLDQYPIDPEAVKIIGSKDALAYGALVLRKDTMTITLAMSDPCDIQVIDNIRFMTELNVKPLLCKKFQISQHIKTMYKSTDTVQDILKSTIEDNFSEMGLEKEFSSLEPVELDKINDESPAFVKLVHKIISDAVSSRSSDIHIEPQEKSVSVRYRIDGALKKIIQIPRHFHQRLCVRLKILARLDITEQRKIQEGRIKIFIDQRKIDLRISVLPAFYGEKIVLRILDVHSTEFDIAKIGFEPGELEAFQDAILRPQGVILVTGPTGSGKTTTLYAALQHIKSESKNIVTIEDPVEYLIDGITQLQLNEFKDITFASGLRSILRQDPDVILVGEIRDRETADIAFRASLTGHLVFSTLHTNNAASSITRLLDIGLEPYMISSSILLFVAQRLVRLICPNCLERYSPDKKMMDKFENYLKNTRIKHFYQGKGCSQCGFTGYFGRTSIFELLKVDENIRNLIFHKNPESVILKEAITNGMKTLAESGVMKVASGQTTLEEVARVTDVVEEQKNDIYLNKEEDSILTDII